jgi:flagellar biosynthetic protein FliR
MPNELSLTAGKLLGFLLVLARVSGVMSFVPFPGFRNGPDLPRIVFSLMLTICMFPKWPTPASNPSAGGMVMWILAEAAFGITLGLMVSFLLEAFQLGAQVLGIQAGYTYAATIDPATQADAGVISVVVQLMAGLCFFVLGTDRALLSSLAVSFDHVPAGGFVIDVKMAERVIAMGASMLTTGLRIALPVIAFLLLTDFALALLGRIQSQMQLLTLAFPAKMLITLVLLASLSALFPRLFQAAAARTLEGVAILVGQPLPAAAAF